MGKKFLKAEDVRKSSEKINLSEKEFFKIFDNNTNGIIIINAQNEKIEEANRVFAGMLGKAKNKFVGKKLWEIGAFIDSRKAKEIIQKIKKGRHCHYDDVSIKTKKGIISAELAGHLHGIDHKKIIQLNICDITRKKISEETVRESEEKFRTIFENSQDGIMLVDIKSRKFIMGNEAFCKMIGYSAKEITQIGVDNIHPKKDLPFVVDKFNKLANGFIKKVNDLPVEKKNGEVIYVDVTASLVDVPGKKYLMGNFRDITERKKAEEETKKLLSVIRYSAELINLADSKGNMIFLNEAGSEMLGINQNDFPNHNILEVIPERLLPLVKKELLPSLFSGKRWQGDLQYVNLKTKKITDVHAIAFPIKDEKTGKIICFANVSMDITERKKVENMKTEFVSLASHQLRTPITSINWNTEMLINGDLGEVSEEQKEVLKEIHRSNEKMISLIDSLLNVSRLELGTFAISPEPTDIVKISQNILREFDSEIKEENIKITEEYEPELKNVQVDPKLVDIILQNLISNAIKYAPEKGNVGIEIKKENNIVEMEVSDNGIGIPKYQQDKIFSKLFRADNAQTKDPNGTGLGLYVVSLILKAVNGKIKFRSKEGKGSTFSVSLPLSGMKKRISIKTLV